MPMLYQSWVRHESADPREWGFALLQWCRVNRARPAVVDAKYWLQAPTTAAVLIEFERGADVTAGVDDEDFSKALLELGNRSTSAPWQTWMEASAGADTLTRAGV